MATASALPPTLQEKLAELNRQVRARRTARGLSLTLLALTVLAAVAVAADALLDFPAAVRGGLLIAWAVLGAAVVWRVLLRPLTRPVSPADLAAAVESEFPVLGERLSSTVELAERADPGNGSPYLIGLLARETEIRTRRLDFGEAVSTRDARWLTVAAGVALLAALAPLLFAPPAREHARRFFLPWVTAPLDVPYQVVVTSGDPAVRRGDPVTLAAYAEPTRPGAEVPAGAELLVRRDGGPEEAFGMQSTQANVYFLKRERVDADFEYAVRVGHARSDWHRVRAVDPVELTGETKITVTPPEYAKAALGEATLAGFGDIAPLQHSSVTFDLRFTRPPAVAALEWLPADAKPGEAARRVSLPAGGEQAAHTLQARQSGTLRLILETEEGVRTEVPPLKIDVRPDGPPRFSRVTGVTEQAREVPPGERVPVSFTVLDDVAVGEAALEYRVNGGPVQTQAIPLPGAGRQEVTTDCELDLAGKASEGDRLEFRLRAADNRDLPGEKLGPQVAYFPSGDRWAELRIARGAEPLKEQEITAQQREIERRLDDLLRELKADARTLYSLQVGAKNRDRLPFEQEEQIRELRDRARANAQALDELARDTALTPELQALADQFRDVADRQLRPAEDALREADRSERADPRDRAMARAQDQIGEAIRRLEQLQEQGERLARERIEREQLERLAREQQELAEKAAKAGPQELPEIQRRQRELEQELERLTRESDALREAANANKQEQAEELARRARDLADRQRELEQAMRETEQQARSGRLAELLERQKDLARRAAEFARENDQATRAAQARPLDPKLAQKAAEALEDGELYEALKNQERAAFDLDRLAAEFERAAAQAGEPREAARQLARLQEDLRQRVAQATRGRPLADLPEQQREGFRREQEAIRRAAERLSVPPDDPKVAPARRDALERAEKAAEALREPGQGRENADKRMAESRDALNRLAEQLPDREQRLRAARAEAERLKREQDAIARQAGEAAREFEDKDPNAPETRRELAGKLAELARRQAEIAERLGKLDAPNLEARRERARDAVDRALNDLLDARPQDVAASQQDARRQLERLRQALDGQTPADEKARELARNQADLAGEAERLARAAKPDPNQSRELQRRQQEIAREFDKLQAPEAPRRHADAADALRKAEEAARDPDPGALAGRARDAADRLEQLADQMGGKESDARRAERLARKQAEAAAERRSDQPRDPNEELQAQRLRRQIEEETRQLRAGADAQREKQQALEALERLGQENPQRQAQAQREAADAMRRLADKLAGRDDPAAKAAEIAREQRDLADRAREAGPRQPGAREAADRQADLARRTGQLAEGGPMNDAAREAQEKMQAAREALEKAQAAGDAKEELARAAEAAERMAKELAGRQAAADPMNPPGGEQQRNAAKPGDQPLEQLARQLAEQQRRLARQTQQAARQGDQQGLERAAEGQRELNRQASDLPARDNPEQFRRARDAMNRAEQALANRDGEEAGRRQNEAAQALEQLARQAAEQARDAPQGARAGGQPASNFPSREHAEQARQMAQEQRRLRDQALDAARDLADRARQPAPEGNPLADAVRRQEEIARRAEEMARSAAERQGQQSPAARQAGQAAEAARQAARQLGSGAVPRAQEAGRAAAQRLGQMAQANPDSPAGEEAARLAREQEALNRELDPMRGDPQAARAQQQARQQQLEAEARRLEQELGRMAEGMGGRPGRAAGQARESAEGARSAMSQAAASSRQNQPGAARAAQQEAARRLDEAARQAAMAAGRQPGDPQPSPAAEQLGRSLRQAQNRMGQAQNRLGQGQARAAGEAMEQASDALSQASQQLGQSRPAQAANRQPAGQPGGNVGTARGAPDLSLFPEEARKYAGKPWGELPGELRTRIVQDLRARYGEDYARVIKYYFEQLAERK